MTGKNIGHAREDLLKTIQAMMASGLVTGTSGNASLRLDTDRVLITPTSHPYDLMRPDDLAIVDMEGNLLDGPLPPSSERKAHLAVYQDRTDVQAVIHTHSIYASICAVCGLDIPPIIDELVVRVGGGVRVAEYAFPGDWALGRSAMTAMEDRRAVLLRNHGLLAAGRDLREALDICQLVERVAHIFVFARSLGRAVPLEPSVVEREQEMYRQTVTEQQSS